MTELHKELLGIAERLEKLAARSREDQIKQPLNRMDQAAWEIWQSWCGSWKGDHANVYYLNFQTPPTSIQFGGQVLRDWIEYDSKTVLEAIMKKAMYADLSSARCLSDEASSGFETSQNDLLSLLELEIEGTSSSLLSDIRDKVKALVLLDSIAMTKGFILNTSPSSHMLGFRNLNQLQQIPLHFMVLGEVLAIKRTFEVMQELETLTKQAASHIQRKARQEESRSPNSYQVPQKRPIGFRV